MKAEDCAGLTEHPAGRHLAKLASEIPGDLAIVEIGVYMGRSLLYLAEGSMTGNEAVVYGVDPFDLPRPSKPKYKDPATFDYAIQAITDSPAGNLIVIQKNFSVNAARSWDGPKIGLWYLDADHRYGPVLQDFEVWSEHFAENAIVCFDDYDVETFPGVVKAVDELYADGRIHDLHVPAGCSRLAVAKCTR